MKKQLLLIAMCFTGLRLFAQSLSPSDDYLKTMNSYVPGSPESAQMMKYQDYPVNLFTGTPEVSIPIYTLTGKGISIPINISYHAGGGVKVDEQATNVGLGWLLNAGGEITREVRGMPDDQAGLISNVNPISYYLNKLHNEPILNNASNIWTKAQHGRLDLEPDIYYFSFGSNSGKFIYDDSLHQFVSISERGNYKISLNTTTSTWRIIATDGTEYTFDSKEISSSQVYSINSPNGLGFSDPQTTSWKLSKIVNADKTDSIILNYGSTFYHYFTPGSNIAYQLYNDYNVAGYRPNLNTYSYNNITGNSKLTNITGTDFSVDFVDELNSRLDMTDNQKALSKVIIKNKGGVVIDIFKFSHSYFQRLTPVGSMPPDAIPPGRQSLRLDSVAEYGNSESNSSPLVHSFSYNPLSMPCRMSFAKDFWGYANSNTYVATLAPETSLTSGNITTVLPGANRYPDTVQMKAGILEQIKLPTGGTINYTYEPNTIGYAIRQTLANTTDVSNDLFGIKDSLQVFNETYDTVFTVNQPPDPYINHLEGGVIADIGIYPKQTNGVEGYTSINYGAPWFELVKIADLPNYIGQPVYLSYQLQYGNRNNVLLPNGVYKMTAHVSTLNNGANINSIRIFSFSVIYKILATNTAGLHNNYVAAGLRVKSIVSKDPYSNVLNERKFRYHDPVTDSSYGFFIGTDLSDYREQIQSIDAGNGMYLVRTGSNNLPGQGSNSSGVVYSTVMEESSDNAEIQRIVHHYSLGVSIYPYYSQDWPFVPARDIECARGNEGYTEWKMYNGSTFTNAKDQRHIYDFDPSSFVNSNAKFARKIFGIKCQSDSYSNATANGGDFPPQDIQEYYTNINRLYLTSDSTTTYDFSNANNGTTQWHDYTYGDKNMQPIIVRSGNSDGSVSIQKNYYASDVPDSNSNINATLASQMVTANRINQPLGTTQFKDGQLLSQQYTYSHFSGSKLLVDSMRQALFNNPLDVEIKVQSYSPAANPLSILLRGNKYRKYIWNDTLSLPLATCVTGQDSKFIFTSFEYPNEIPWTETSRNTSNAFSGKYAYSLTSSSTISISGLSSATGMDVYVWSTGSNISANGTTLTSTGKTKGNWTLYTAHLSNTAMVTLSGNALIDQLLVLPTGSQFQGNVYDGFNRVTAVVNDLISTSFYEYDNFGRLATVKDEQGNILKSTSYQYQGPQ